MSTSIRALSLAAITIAGCTNYIAPHHVYAPLFDHAGQVDVNVRAGTGTSGGAGISANAGYAIVDSLEIVGGVDLNLGRDQARHYGGHVGIGTFVREDVFRLEAIAGAYAGWAEGRGLGFGTGAMSTSSFPYQLSGGYAMPYAQGLIGFERGHFELAGGLRIWGFMSDVTITPESGSPPRGVSSDGYERLYVEPLLTVRFPIEIFRVDLQTGWPISAYGDVSPADLAPETEVMWYFAVGIGFQFDTIEQPFVDEAPPAPVYVAPPPQPVYVPPPPTEPAPAAPPTYQPSPVIVQPQPAPPPP